MLKLGELKNAKGAHRNTRRLGRGSGSTRGKTAGKGHKGQLARSGNKHRIGFEGGQTPLYRKLPKKGFTNVFRTEYTVLNLGKLDQLNMAEVTPEALEKSGAVNLRGNPLKILGTGELKKAVKVRAQAVSKSAKEKIEKAGGSVEIIAL